MLIDDLLRKLEERVERLHGRIRADVVHEKLIGRGYPAVGAEAWKGGCSTTSAMVRS
jgi:hypothetical protein